MTQLPDLPILEHEAVMLVTDPGYLRRKADHIDRVVAGFPTSHHTPARVARAKELRVQADRIEAS